MKRQVPVILAVLSGAIALGGPPARAQSEIDPDHFESPNTEALDKAKTDAGSKVEAIRYDGKFRLPYTVECNGKSLRAGRYSVSLRSNGKVVRATLNHDGQGIGIVGVVVRRTVNGTRNDAAVVEHKGTKRRLSAIQVAKLDFLLEPEPQTENSVQTTPRRLERLPLTETVLENDEPRAISN
jgi:hypothetical protein